MGSWFNVVFAALNKKYNAGLQVVNIDSYIATDRENHLTKIKDDHIKYIKADISSGEFDPQKLTSKPDYIIHAAGVKLTG